MAQSPRSLNISFEVLASHPNKEWLLADLRKQIAKDFNCLSTEVPERELETWLTEHLKKLQTEKGSLSDLLYRIDLDEKYWGEEHSVLALAILKREAIKVYFRAQYSGRI